MSLVARVRRTLVERGLVARGMRVLAACSGGPDSAALLGALAELAPELGFALEAASVDHGLRPDAQADVATAREQASAVAVPFHALRVRVAQLACGGSLQARARQARYAALSELAAALGAERIAVGHTQDDQAETVLQRLLRGARVRGLSAIEPLRDDGVIRPLLDVTRADAHAFARARFAQIASDPSNADPRFTRVRVRKDVLPVLEREDSRLRAHLAQLADDAREHAALADRAAEELLRRARSGPETLEIAALRAAAGVVRRAALRLWLAEQARPLSHSQLGELDDACLRGRGEIWLGAGIAVHAEAGSVLRVCVRRTSRS